MPNTFNMVERIKELEEAQHNWAMEKEAMALRINVMEEMLVDSKVGALRGVKSSLKFQESENLIKPFVCIQLQNGNTLYFDNMKPFDLFTIVDGTRIAADLSSLEGEFDCSFRGKIGNNAFFRAVRGKVIKFFRATIEHGRILFEQVNELKTSEISLFKNQPLYFVELSREWSVYQFHENHSEMEGKKFDISGINHLSKYDRQYHREVLYLFREHPMALVEKVNCNVVRVEGPLLDLDACASYLLLTNYRLSFYTPSNVDAIYILNADHNVLLILNTSNLTVSQVPYEPPSDSNNHSVVGIHEGTLTMAFDGVWGRHLYTARMP